MKNITTFLIEWKHLLFAVFILASLMIAIAIYYNEKVESSEINLEFIAFKADRSSQNINAIYFSQDEEQFYSISLDSYDLKYNNEYFQSNLKAIKNKEKLSALHCALTANERKRKQCDNYIVTELGGLVARPGIDV